MLAIHRFFCWGSLRSPSTYGMFLLFLSPSLFAQDLGVIGPVYAIEEESLIEVMMRQVKGKVRAGVWRKMMDKKKVQTQALLNRPVGVQMPRAHVNRQRYVNPSVVLEKDVMGADGQVLYARGTAVNPLDYMRLSNAFIFFDGDDNEQVAWVQSLAEKSTAPLILILTNGPFGELVDTFKTRLYFDQYGRLSQYFGIEALPTVMSQEQRTLKLQEYTW